MVLLNLNYLTIIIVGHLKCAQALSPRRRLHFLRKGGSRSSVSGVRQNRPPNNNNAPARYFLLFYSGPVPLLAAESWLSGPPRKNNAPARYFFLFYSGSVLFARRRKLAFPPNQRSGSILRCLLRRVVRMGPGAFSSEKSNPRGVPTVLRI